MSDIHNCHFCGHVPEYPTRFKKKVSMTCCRNKKCPIFGIFIKVEMWNGEVSERVQKRGNHYDQCPATSIDDPACICAVIGGMK